MRQYIVDGVSFKCEFYHWYMGTKWIDVTVSIEDEDRGPGMWDVDFTPMFKDIVEKYDPEWVYEDYKFTYIAYIDTDCVIQQYEYERGENTYTLTTLRNDFKKEER